MECVLLDLELERGKTQEDEIDCSSFDGHKWQSQSEGPGEALGAITFPWTVLFVHPRPQ